MTPRQFARLTLLLPLIVADMRGTPGQSRALSWPGFLERLSALIDDPTFDEKWYVDRAARLLIRLSMDDPYLQSVLGSSKASRLAGPMFQELEYRKLNRICFHSADKMKAITAGQLRSGSTPKRLRFHVGDAMTKVVRSSHPFNNEMDKNINPR